MRAYRKKMDNEWVRDRLNSSLENMASQRNVDRECQQDEKEVIALCTYVMSCLINLITWTLNFKQETLSCAHTPQPCVCGLSFHAWPHSA